MASRPWAPLAFTFFFTAIVAGRGVGDLALSFDEFFTLNAIVTSPLNSLQYEGPLVPYYGLLWLWSLGGEWTADVWLRVPSLIAVVLAAVMTSRIALRFGGLPAAYFAGLLFALNPGVHLLAHDARPYALGMSLFVAVALLLLRALDADQVSWWVAFSVALVMATLVMPNGLIIFIPLVALYSSVRSRFFLRRSFLLSVAPTALMVIVGVTVFASAITSMRASLPSPALSWIPTGVIWTGISEAESYGAPGTFAAVLLLLSTLTGRGRRVLWAVLASMLFVWVLSQGPSSHWMGRTFVTFMPVMAIAAAMGTAKLQRRQLTAALVVAVLFALPGYTAVRLWDSEADLQMATQIVEQHAAATDQIFGDGYLGNGRPYELAAGLAHYGTSEPPWEVTTEPTREFWLLYPDYPCDELFSDDVRAGGVSLRRCAAPQ